MIELEVAARQAEILTKAAAASPVRQIRYYLAARGREWSDAVTDHNEANDCDPEAVAVIELAGTITPGMDVWVGGKGWHWVRRVLRRDGLSLHLQEQHGPRDLYVNPQGADSPVVVRA